MTKEQEQAAYILELEKRLKYITERCEAAENLSKLYGDWQDLLNPDADEMSKDALEAFKKWGAALKIWQELKNTTP